MKTLFLLLITALTNPLYVQPPMGPQESCIGASQSLDEAQGGRVEAFVCPPVKDDFFGYEAANQWLDSKSTDLGDFKTYIGLDLAEMYEVLACAARYELDFHQEDFYLDRAYEVRGAKGGGNLLTNDFLYELGVAFYRKQAYDTAIFYLRKAHAMLRYVYRGEHIRMGDVMIYLALSHLGKGDRYSAGGYFLQIPCAKVEESVEGVRYHYRIGGLLAEHFTLTAAEAHIKAALTKSEELDEMYQETAEFFCVLGPRYMREKNKKVVARFHGYLTRGLPLFERFNRTAAKYAYRLLTESYPFLADFSQQVSDDPAWLSHKERTAAQEWRHYFTVAARYSRSVSGRKLRRFGEYCAWTRFIFPFIMAYTWLIRRYLSEVETLDSSLYSFPVRDYSGKRDSDYFYEQVSNSMEKPSPELDALTKKDVEEVFRLYKKANNFRGFLKTAENWIRLAGGEVSWSQLPNICYLYPSGHKLYVARILKEDEKEVIDQITLPAPESELTELRVGEKSTRKESKHWVACSPDGKQIITIDNAYVHHMLSAGNLHEVIARYARGVSIEVPADVMEVLSRYIGLWRARSIAQERVPLLTASFSHDSKRLALASSHHMVIYAIEEGGLKWQKIGAYTFPDNYVKPLLDWARDDRYVYVSQRDFSEVVRRFQVPPLGGRGLLSKACICIENEGQQVYSEQGGTVVRFSQLVSGSGEIYGVSILHKGGENYWFSIGKYKRMQPFRYILMGAGLGLLHAGLVMTVS